MKKILGGLVVTSVLITGLFTTASTISAAPLNNYNEKSVEIVQSSSTPVVSKFIRIPWEFGMPSKYYYDDGMFRGTLKFVGAYYEPEPADPENNPALGGWYEGTVSCYKNCAIANSIVDEK